LTSRNLYLADTNVLLRLAKRDRAGYPVVRKASSLLEARGIRLAFTLQNMTEFWNVSTRPIKDNGFGLTVEECETNVWDIEKGLIFLPDNEAVYNEWRRIVLKHRVSGVQVHDARLAASMYAHGLTHILTFNIADFARFDGITAVHPDSVEHQFSLLP